MPVVFANNLDVQKAVVLDARCVGNSGDTEGLPNAAQGLLRYETDDDNWVYYKNSTDKWQPLISDSLPTRSPPQSANLMHRVLMEGHLNVGSGNAGVGDTGPIWQRLSLNDLSNHEIENGGASLTVHNTDDDTENYDSKTTINGGMITCIAASAAELTVQDVVVSGFFSCTGTSSVNKLTINTTASPTANDEILFSNGRIYTSSNQIRLQSYTTYLILKGDLLVYEATRHHYFYGQNIYYYNSGTTSDDRLKWEEEDITNGLEVINKLKPQIYWKGKKLNVEPSEEERTRESGFIAQEVKQIPELAHTVSISEDTERSADTHFLDYTQLMAFQVAGIQELHKLVKSQNDRILALESKISISGP
jgi:hypothetical protein